MDNNRQRIAYKAKEYTGVKKPFKR